MLESLAQLRKKHGLKKGLERKLDRLRNRFLHPSTRSTLARDLRALGISDGDVVLVHSAFSKIGYVRGGAESFLLALRDVIGPNGTIVMPSFPFNDPAAEYAAKAPVYDVLHTPSAVGELTERFRLQPGTLRSLHPTHSFCASGPDAAEMLRTHHLDHNPFGAQSPLGFICRAGGKCLLVGVGLKNCSPFRIIENPDTYPHPVFEKPLFEFRVRDQEGKEMTVMTLVHSLALAPERRTGVFHPPLLERGMLKEGKVGLAASSVVDCKGLEPLLLELAGKGITPYSEASKAFPR